MSDKDNNKEEDKLLYCSFCGKNQNEVRKLIKKLGKEKAIIISTHILEEVNILCNRTMILSNGKLLIDDKPSNVLKRSKNYNNTLVAVEEISAKDLRSELLNLGKFDNVEIKDNMCLINTKKMSKNFSLTNYLKKKRYTIKHFSINKGDLDEVFRSLTKTN